MSDNQPMSHVTLRIYLFLITLLVRAASSVYTLIRNYLIDRRQDLIVSATRVVSSCQDTTFYLHKDIRTLYEREIYQAPNAAWGVPYQPFLLSYDDT